MNKIEKLFKKISKKERQLLLALVGELQNKEKRKKLPIKKLKDSDFFRFKKGRFRIIFHFESFKEIVIDSIKLRSEKTYKNL